MDLGTLQPVSSLALALRAYVYARNVRVAQINASCGFHANLLCVHLHALWKVFFSQNASIKVFSLPSPLFRFI